MAQTAHASAYVKGGRLCILGVANTPMGPVPFAHHVEVGADMKDGPIDMDDPNVQSALDQSRGRIAGIIKTQQMRLAAGSLVERARVGDQNAMAMIREVGENSRRGNKRARIAFMCLSRYIELNPPGAPKRIPPLLRSLHRATRTQNVDHFSSAVGAFAGSIDDPYTAALMVANAGKAQKQIVERVASRFEGDQDAFDAGYRSQAPMLALRHYRGARDAVLAGHVMRTARVIQGVRSGQMPVSRLCPIAGWELGE